MPQEPLSRTVVGDPSFSPPAVLPSGGFIETAISLANQVPFSDVSVTIEAAGTRIRIRPTRKERP
jgi:hypothetical protein